MPVESNLEFRPVFTETNPMESVSDGEDQTPTAGVVGSVCVGSDPVSFFGWIGSSDGFGHLLFNSQATVVLHQVLIKS